MPLLQLAHRTFQRNLTVLCCIHQSNGGLRMLDTCVLHDDYEDFAQKYLGVDYEDFIGLQLGLPDEDEIEIEYPVGV